MSTEEARLRGAVKRLKKLLERRYISTIEKRAINIGIEHIEARLIDIEGSKGEADWRSERAS